MNISLIIPIKNDYDVYVNLCSAINLQTYQPKEIIFIDSSNDNEIENYLIKKIKISNINYIKKDKKFPGEARNIGIKEAKYDYVAFLDSKTIPDANWLFEQKEKLIKDKLDVVFGNTKYISKTKFQHDIKSATFGNISHITTPGTLIKKNILLENLFIEGVRTADDLEWRERLINKKTKIGTPDNNQLIYYSLPKNLLSVLNRYFVYSFHTAQVNVDNKLKFFYFIILTSLFFLIIPRWNFYLPGWDKNHPLFIQNHEKFYILLIISLFLIMIIVQNFSIFNKYRYNTILKSILVICCIYLVYNWNYYITNWIETSAFYIPHITKIFISLVFITSFIVRGIYYPLKRDINSNYLFPFNWLKIGFYGFLIDIVKAPAYLYGAIIPKFFLKKNIADHKSVNLVFYPKYGIKSPSFRTRFLSYKDYLIKNNVDVKTKQLFSDTFYNKRIFEKKINFLNIFLFYYKRLVDLIFRKKPFVALTHIELLPYVPYLAEIILLIRRIPYIVDIDDAVYLRFENNNKLLFLLDKIKFNFMLSNCSAILAGNQYHYNYLKKFNNKIYYIPTNIDFSKYNYRNYPKKHKTFTIVWIGTPSTTIYLQKIINVLNKIKQQNNINIKIIGADKKMIKNLDCYHIDWNENTEVSEISKCHLGIMPLLNTNWELGKCAYKILQYMSLKIPVIASPVGVNSQIITDTQNGMLAKDEEEWYSKILEIINDRDLSNKISNNGYETVKKQFNLENYKLSFFKIIKNIT